MNPTLLEGYRTGAESAASNVAQFQQDIPGLMSGLKTNLTSIFAKDNPMIQARENALTTYLNTPSQTRANLLPSNQPVVGGSPLNFSPTQQNAMVESAQNAALVPLLGLNQSIVGQYGNIGEILQAAAQTYQSQLDAAKTRATSAQQLYELAVKQDQFDRELALKQKEISGQGNMLKELQRIIEMQNQGNQQDVWDTTIPTPAAPQPQNVVEAVAQGVPYTGGSIPLANTPSQPSLWDRFMGLIGATPRQETAQPTTGGLDLSGYNFNNMQPFKSGV